MKNSSYLLFFMCTCMYSFVKTMDITSLSQLVRYKCNTCDKVFATPQNLNIHMKIKHAAMCDLSPNQSVQEYTKEKLIECTECPERFYTKKDLYAHEVVTHGRESFTCDECGTVLFSYGGFQTHKKTHLETKPLECYLCSKQFVQKHHLKNHMLSKHTEEKSYECNICTKKFSTKELRDLHTKREEKQQFDISENISKFDINIEDYLPPLKPLSNTENINDQLPSDWIDNL